MSFKIKSYFGINTAYLIFVLVLLFLGCQNNIKDKDWIVLFDGTTTECWRAYNGDRMPPGWQIVDSILTFKTEQILEEDYDYKGSTLISKRLWRMRIIKSFLMPVPPYTAPALSRWPRRREKRFIVRNPLRSPRRKLFD